MTRPRRGWRLAGILFGFGFRAAPGWMTATMLLNLAGAVSQGLLAYGFEVFADAIPHADTGKLVFAICWTTAFASLSWAGLLLAANLLSGLNSRVDLYVSERLARVTSSAIGIRHLEDPTFARDLESFDENRFLIGNAPRADSRAPAGRAAHCRDRHPAVDDRPDPRRSSAVRAGPVPRGGAGGPGA